MKPLGVLLVAALLVGAGWVGHWFFSRDPGAVARVAQLQHRADSLEKVAAHRDTVHLAAVTTARARTDAALSKPFVSGAPAPLEPWILVDSVKVLVAGERAACDTALAGKDSTIAETAAVRTDAIAEARHLAARGPSRLALSTVLILSPRDAPRLGESLTYRVTRILGFDINAGIAYRP